MSCGVGCRCSLDPALLWLWCSPATTALIQLLAWEPPCAMGVALKSQKKKKIYKQELLLWHSGIGGGLSALGRRFHPKPGTLG